MPKRIDLTNKKFGYWTARKYLGNSMWQCEGENNEIKNIHSYDLRHKNIGVTVRGAMPEGVLHEQFNDWYVEEYLGSGFWKCKCKCGTTGKVNTYDLKNGKSKRCSKCSHEKNLINLKDRRFGEWEVLEYAGNMRWKCRCSCGTIRNILGKDLRNGISTNCGCKRNNHIIKDDLTDKEFGYLKVLGYTGKNQIWRCLCKACNTETDVFRDSLVSGKTKSCGCMKEELRKNTLFEKYGDTNTTRINNPREQWQIEAIESKEKFEEFLKEYQDIKTATELAEVLNITPAYMAQVINKLGFEDIIKHNSGVSDIEIQIRNFIETFGYNIIYNDRKILNGRELDIYIPEKRLAIEFNGSYWHSELYKNELYHQKKTLQCSEKGIHLIHIFEYEWNNEDTQNKIKKYITGLLGNSSIIYAKNTTIKVINNVALEKEFLNNNHLQGYIPSQTALGCYYNDELIGIMSFGKPRFSSEDIELLRLCWDSSYSVVGGSEKLFRYYISNYKPKSIVSYCDLTKFSGHVYNRLGFKENNITKPNYVWVNTKTNFVVSRYQSQKQKLIDKGLGVYGNTENEIMYNIGYIKIYNSGNKKFTINLMQED